MKGVEHFIRTNRGVMLLELVLSITLFALGMVTMAMMFYAFLSGSKLGTYQPHADRLQMESVCRALDQDFQTYRPIFAYNVELQDQDNSWVLPGAITLQGSEARTYDFQQQYKPVEADPTSVALINELKNNDNFIMQTGLNPVVSTSTRRAHTLLFLGIRSAQAQSGRYVVYIDVVYHILVTNQNNPTRITYEIARIQRDEGEAKGITHYVTFNADGFDSSKLDQPAPEFFYEGNGVVQGNNVVQGTNVIRSIIPNPFSQRVINAVTANTVYKTPFILRYYLSTTGL